MKGIAAAVSNSKLKQMQKSLEGDYAKGVRIVRVGGWLVYEHSVPSKRGNCNTHPVQTTSST